MATIERPRILLIHGFLSAPAVWDRLRAHLEGVAEVAAPPLSGFGGTAPPEEMLVETLAAGLQPVVELFRPTHVVGHSMGAIVALAVAASNPGRFESVGLIGLPVFDNRPEALSFLHGTSALRRNLLRSDRLAHAGCRTLYVTRWGWTPLLPWVAPGVPRAHAHGAFKHSREGHGRALDDVVFAGRVPELANGVTGMVRLFHGEADRVAPFGRARDFAAERGWGFDPARNAGHQVMVTHPRLTARWLRSRLLIAEPPSTAGP